jgi:hypothetical protein
MRIPNTLNLESYQVWLDDHSPPITATIEKPDPLILRIRVPYK